MKKTIYFISRTQSNGRSGGAIIRKGTIEHLRRNGYRVIEVALSDENRETQDCILVKGPCSSWSVRFYLLLFAIGFIPDYLEPWANRVYNILKDRVKEDDVILATSGGELATLLIATRIKEKIGCRTIINLHDPILYTLIDGKYLYKSKWIIWNRDRALENIFRLTDKIVTSSLVYRNSLIKRYPSLGFKISNHHFGYIDDYNGCIKKLTSDNIINVVFGGNAGRFQKADILIELAAYFPNVQFTFIGNTSTIESCYLDNVIMRPLMSHEEYVHYMLNYADIGFLSLEGNISNYCVPSKLYEYINIGLPILAAIEGDARSIINDNGLGIATDYNLNSLSLALQWLLEENRYLKIRQKVVQQRRNWYMGSTIKELIKAIEE